MKELGSNKVNLGQKFGSWTIIEQVENYVSGKEKQEQTQWLCKCTCGYEKNLLHMLSEGRKKNVLIYGEKDLVS